LDSNIILNRQLSKTTLTCTTLTYRPTTLTCPLSSVPLYEASTLTKSVVQRLDVIFITSNTVRNTPQIY